MRNVIGGTGPDMPPSPGSPAAAALLEDNKGPCDRFKAPPSERITTTVSLLHLGATSRIHRTILPACTRPPKSRTQMSGKEPAGKEPLSGGPHLLSVSCTHGGYTFRIRNWEDGDFDALAKEIVELISRPTGVTIAGALSCVFVSVRVPKILDPPPLCFTPRSSSLCLTPRRWRMAPTAALAPSYLNVSG